MIDSQVIRVGYYNLKISILDEYDIYLAGRLLIPGPIPGRLPKSKSNNQPTLVPTLHTYG
jgi:hypothetical protein